MIENTWRSTSLGTLEVLGHVSNDSGSDWTMERSVAFDPSEADRRRLRERFRVRVLFFFFYFRSDSGFSIKPDPIKTRFGFKKKKKTDSKSYYINGAKKPNVIGVGRVPAGREFIAIPTFVLWYS